MAVYNEIQHGRFNRFLQKLTGIKGRAPVKQLGGEIMPVVTMPSGVEDRYLFTWESFSVEAFFAGVAAQNSVARIRNPVGSNTIGVIEKIRASPGVADTITLTQGVASTDLANLPGSTRMDPRGRATGTLVVSFANNVATVGGFMDFISVTVALGQADFILDDGQEMPLLPGDILQLSTVGLNESLRFTFTWRERFLEESERT